ncbi:dihydroxyacetone kinase family protein [Arthrobacter sp.]|uniref:dihydroxyacetone kinase family protein n=1 Tax=Arthrobacter sp. TaxID=1667 RepID=UPI0028125F0F|nr:dihydroxyacetone kinase family protein [Arthrobacter sp.]
MTALRSDAATFAEDMLTGFVAANRQYVRRVDGGVVRATAMKDGQVSLVVGGGSGHYPAFAGLVGPGLASGSVCGNIFASPSASQIRRVSRATHRGGGVLLSYGNYAGDVLHFGLAQEQLRSEGIDVRTVVVTDDIASAPQDEMTKRRGIAGDLTVFKVAGAAAEAGLTLDEVEELAQRTNARTRSLGVAFAGCTLPGADEPLFTVAEGTMSIGLGIHGEPGISEAELPTADELAELLVTRLLADKPHDAGTRLSIILNGLGTVKYEELFVLFGKVSSLLEREGLTIVEPECGELVTSLDMSGLSLTFFWLDDELERWWAAPANTPAYRKGAISAELDTNDVANLDEEELFSVEGQWQHEAAPSAARLLGLVSTMLTEAEHDLGRLDAIAGDGDHGIGMARGAEGAAAAAAVSQDAGHGVGRLLREAGAAWAEKAGGTSGALWGAAITAVGRVLQDEESLTPQAVAAAVDAALEAMVSLGKAQLGDKTMLDALIPFAETLRNAVDAGTDLGEAWDTAASRAEAAAAETANLRPRMGRARPLAEKSLGHPDAGAVSLAMVVATVGAAHKDSARKEDVLS